MFIATANTTSGIHPALLDRMEIIELSGYIVEEKVEIAKRHLVPKQMSNHGMEKGQVIFPKKTLEYITESFTRESGVRQLDKQISKILRVIAKYIAFEETYPKNLSIDKIMEILGPPRFVKDKYLGNNFAGVVTGLAWTATGGEILFVETSLSQGEGKLTLTGNLGDVMKESAMAALSYLRSNAGKLGIDYKVFTKYDLHIHVPAGAVPKDGPSAGITILVSLASVFTQRKVKNKIAMTGEITLRGKILPVGGIKEKILAAKRSGIKEIILCSKNRKDIDEIEKSYIGDIKVHYVDHVNEVISIALLKEKVTDPMDFIVE